MLAAAPLLILTKDTANPNLGHYSISVDSGAWLKQSLTMITLHSDLSIALAFLLAQWSSLIWYAERGDFPINNDQRDNAISPFVIGRKVWLFSDTIDGAKASAVVYSPSETAKANGFGPYTSLRHMFA